MRIKPQSWKRVARRMALAAVVLSASVLSVAQSAPAAVSPRSDGQIEMDVVRALDASKALKQDLVAAATDKGVVTLTGTVASEASKELAEVIVVRVPGVTAVRNELKIGKVSDMAAPPVPEEPPMASEPPPPGPMGEGPALPPQAYSREQAEAPAPPPSRMPYERAQPPVAVPTPDEEPAQQTPPEFAKGPVTIAEGTLLQVRTDEPVSSKQAQPGQPVQFTVIRDVVAGGKLALPRGATLRGQVVDARPAGAVSGNAELALKLNSIDLGGRIYPLESDLFRVQGPSKTGQTVGNAVAGGLIGTMIGCIAGGGTGCAIGAGAGVAAGTAASAASSGPAAWIPSEARVDFHLTAPLTVDPVSQQEALRLAQGISQSDAPQMQQRGDSGPVHYVGPAYYGGPGYYGGAGYYGPPDYGPYPPVSYRPYIVLGGGFHSWR